MQGLNANFFEINNIAIGFIVILYFLFFIFQESVFVKQWIHSINLVLSPIIMFDFE